MMKGSRSLSRRVSGLNLLYGAGSADWSDLMLPQVELVP